MKNLGTLLKQDLKFQLRQGFFLVYGIISLLYIIILKVVPDRVTPTLASLIIFSDPTFIGFFFIGAILFFEREQRITSALFITPVKHSEYILSKCISLTTVTLMVVLLITLTTIGIKINWLYLILGTVLTSGIFILTGIIFSNIFKTITVYIVMGGLIIGPLAAPVIYQMGLSSSVLFYIFPTTPSLKLIFAAFTGSITILDLLYSVLYLSLLFVILFKLVTEMEERKHETI